MAQQRTAPRGPWRAGLLLAAVLVVGCNSPYPESEEGQNILYSTFAEEPRDLRTYFRTSSRAGSASGSTSRGSWPWGRSS
jgi:hypothetical protein